MDLSDTIDSDTDTDADRDSTSAEKFFSVSEDLVPTRTQKPAGLLSLDLGGILAPPLSLREDLKEGNGGQTWEAGKLLARYLLAYHKEDLEGRSIVELGAGGGLVGLAIALGITQDHAATKTTRAPTTPALPTTTSATTIHITDLDPMIPLMNHNIALNFPSPSTADKATSASSSPPVRIHATPYPWGTRPLPTALPSPPDIVLAADCVYFEPAFPSLLRALGDLLAPRTACWFCFRRRRRADMGFARRLRRQFNVVEVEPPPPAAAGAVAAGETDWRRENLHLYKVTRKRKS